MIETDKLMSARDSKHARSLIQQDPPESNNSHSVLPLNKDSEYEGDRISCKNQNTIRLCFININGVPQDNDDEKHHHILETVNQYSFDHVGIAETNCNWSQINQDHRWYERTKTWWECHKSTIAYNKKDILQEPHQRGGTISISIGKIVHKITDSGVDEDLGRWSW